MTTSLGIPDEVTNEAYLDVLRGVIDTSEKYGVPVMIHQQTIDTSKTAIELGARFVMHSSDARLMQDAMRKDFAELRSAAGAASAEQSEDTIETV